MAPQVGQGTRPQNTGMTAKLSRSAIKPVKIALPVFGHLIITCPIASLLGVSTHRRLGGFATFSRGSMVRVVSLGASLQKSSKSYVCRSCLLPDVWRSGWLMGRRCAARRVPCCALLSPWRCYDRTRRSARAWYEGIIPWHFSPALELFGPRVILLLMRTP